MRRRKPRTPLSKRPPEFTLLSRGKTRAVKKQRALIVGIKTADPDLVD